MPAPFHLVCHALLGMLTAYQARDTPSLRHHATGWPLFVALAAAGVALVPATTYQARMYPCHAAGYLLSPETHPDLFTYLGPITLSLVIVNLGALVLGYVAARRGLNGGHSIGVGLAAGAALSGLLAACVLARDRIFSYGSTHDFWAQEAAGITQTPSAWCCLLAYVACALVVARAAFGRRSSSHTPMA